MKVEQDKVVSLSYRLEAKGNVIEVVTKEKPMQFMYGVGYLLPKFEKQIENMSIGDKFDFILQAVDAYGEVDERAIFDLPKNAFEIDGEYDPQYIKIGERLPMQDQEGNSLYGVIERINNDTITMNFNHPLAGNALHFIGEIIDIREATSEDFAGSCGCCSDCDDNCEYDDDDCGCNCC